PERGEIEIPPLWGVFGSFLHKQKGTPPAGWTMLQTEIALIQKKIVRLPSPMEDGLRRAPF
ncbi:hypothetical protein LKD74_17860, partial [Intestinimonas sp. CLA-AA-H199]|nr:hypothetical protein [Intestinimonas aquisgranensis]